MGVSARWSANGSTASSEAALPNDAHKGVNLPSIYQAFTKYRAESNGRLEHVEKLQETAGKTLVEQGKKLEELQETTELLQETSDEFLKVILSWRLSCPVDTYTA